jgi:hypothetical protein
MMSLVSLLSLSLLPSLISAHSNALNEPASSPSPSLSGLYLLDDDLRLVYLSEKGGKFSYCAVDQCSIFNSPLSAVLSDYNASKLPAKYSQLRSSVSECADICKTLELASKKKSDTLLVFTTCNHLNMSVLSLQALRHAKDSFDLVVIDDHSKDGTAEYLRKKVKLPPALFSPPLSLLSPPIAPCSLRVTSPLGAGVLCCAESGSSGPDPLLERGLQVPSLSPVTSPHLTLSGWPSIWITSTSSSRTTTSLSRMAPSTSAERVS